MNKHKTGYAYEEPVHISPQAIIGVGTKVWSFSKVLGSSRVGENCTFGSYVEIGPDVIIGNNVKIQNNVSVYKGITLRDNVFCGPSMVFTNVRNPRAHIQKKDEFTDIEVCEGATIGANATVVAPPSKKLTIGKYALIGAGAVVTKDVLPHALMLGKPAKHIGWTCYCGEILTKTVEHPERTTLPCAVCSRKYTYEKGSIYNSQNRDE